MDARAEGFKWESFPNLVPYPCKYDENVGGLKLEARRGIEVVGVYEYALTAYAFKPISGTEGQNSFSYNSKYPPFFVQVVPAK